MGTVVLSIDAELAWGFHDLADPPRGRIDSARRGWLTLLELLDQYGLPATWAVVGHLMLEECDGRHVNHPAPPDWFPCASGEEWHAPDLVEAILDATVDHELASHTFSHVQFGKEWVTEEIVDAELLAHQDLADEWGIDLESFVFPRNDVAFRHRLAEHGFTVYRGRRPRRWYERSPLRPIGKGAAAMTAAAPPVVLPKVDEHGLVNVPASVDLFGFEGAPKRMLEPFVGDPIVGIVKEGLDALDRHGGVLHGWLHPNNLTSPAAISRLEAIFSAVADARDTHAIRVTTMQGVANEELRRVA